MLHFLFQLVYNSCTVWTVFVRSYISVHRPASLSLRAPPSPCTADVPSKGAEYTMRHGLLEITPPKGPEFTQSLKTIRSPADHAPGEEIGTKIYSLAAPGQHKTINFQLFLPVSSEISQILRKYSSRDQTPK